MCCGSCQFSSHDRPALHSSVLASIQSDKAGFWSCSSKYTSLGRKKCIEKKMMYVLDIGQIATSLSLTPYLTSPQRGCEDNRCALCHELSSSPHFPFVCCSSVSSNHLNRGRRVGQCCTGGPLSVFTALSSLCLQYFKTYSLIYLVLS